MVRVKSDKKIIKELEIFISDKKKAEAFTNIALLKSNSNYLILFSSKI